MNTSTADTVTRREARGLLAGDVAKQLGVGVQTLHYYEREGLIPTPKRTEAGYRLYTPELIERVAFVRKAQALGLPLEEVKEILRLAEQGTCPCGHVRHALVGKLADVDRRVRELRTFRRDLSTFIDRSVSLGATAGGARFCSIVERAAMLRGDPSEVTPLARRRRPRR